MLNVMNIIVLGIIQGKKNMNQDESYNNHPVWDVYDEFRTARLNVLYYESKLKKLSKYNTLTEYMLAILTSSSVAGLWFWENIIGGIVWKVLGVLAILLSLGRPIFNLTDKIKKMSEILSAYKALDHDFNKLKITINQNKRYDKPMWKEFNILLEKKGNIISKSTDENFDDELRKKYTEQVMIELPVDSFYIPKEEWIIIEKNDKLSKSKHELGKSEREHILSVEPTKPWPRKKEQMDTD